VVPPRTGGREGQDQNSEDIEIASYAQHRAANRENKGAGKVENQQKIVDRLSVRERGSAATAHVLLRR